MFSSIEWLIENWKCGIDHQNNDFDDLPFEYDQRLTTWLSIYHKMITLYKGWTIFWSLTYIQNLC